ncbi:MAG: hypothetical protein KF795_12595 [Labilithrix sp.]|nr:hypothetical protein [Labilithrix sp.]
MQAETYSDRAPSSWARHGFLRFDPARLEASFDREPFLVAHDLSSHPLLQLPRLIELARTLPASAVEYNAGDLAIGQSPERTPRTGLGVEETLHQIETCGSWMVLKYIETDPSYARLLDDCLEPVRPHIERIRPGMSRRHAFVFVSSPGAVTPYHVDFEHNFLLHLRGDKRMTVWIGEDRAVMSEEERERKVTGDKRNLPWDDRFAASGRSFDLRPGMGLQVPLSSPHWVEVGAQVSISLSITFLSKHGARVRALHTANAFLRRRGITPGEVGASALSDELKFNAYRIAGRLDRAWARLRRTRRAAP